MRTLRTLSLRAPSGPAAFLGALEGAVAEWTGDRMPATLRKTGISGARLTRRGARFVLSLRRRRRAVAPVICTGRVTGDGAAARIDAEIRPSRQWLWFPTLGTLLFAVQIVLAPPRGTVLVGYAVVLGALWAVNLLAAAIPVGGDPNAEARALESLLVAAAAQPQPMS